MKIFRYLPTLFSFCAFGIIVHHGISYFQSLDLQEQPTQSSTGSELVSSGPVFRGIIANRKPPQPIQCELEGRIAEVYVKNGDYIYAGQPLYKLDDRLLAQQYQQCLAEHNEAKIQLQISQKSQEPQTDPKQIEYHQARLQAQRAELNESELTLKKLTLLLDLGAISLQEQLEQKKLVERLRAELAANDLKQFPAIQEEKDTQKIELAKAKVSTAAAKLNRIKIQKEQMTVKAPYDGVVVECELSVGSLMRKEESPAIVLLKKQTPFVKVALQDSPALHVKKGMIAMVRIASNPSNA
ncbi:MAG: biotin/lipoyl-binding protein, partial [Pirellulaceae bacterium]|nr:biotin/lipoyl-binding protein [Pirellulaceae bacterium]